MLHKNLRAYALVIATAMAILGMLFVSVTAPAMAAGPTELKIKSCDVPDLEPHHENQLWYDAFNVDPDAETVAEALARLMKASAGRGDVRIDAVDPVQNHVGGPKLQPGWYLLRLQAAEVGGWLWDDKFVVVTGSEPGNVLPYFFCPGEITVETPTTVPGAPPKVTVPSPTPTPPKFGVRFRVSIPATGGESEARGMPENFSIRVTKVITLTGDLALVLEGKPGVPFSYAVGADEPTSAKTTAPDKPYTTKIPLAVGGALFPSVIVTADAAVNATFVGDGLAIFWAEILPPQKAPAIAAAAAPGVVDIEVHNVDVTRKAMAFAPRPGRNWISDGDQIGLDGIPTGITVTLTIKSGRPFDVAGVRQRTVDDQGMVTAEIVRTFADNGEMLLIEGTTPGQQLFVSLMADDTVHVQVLYVPAEPLGDYELVSGKADGLLPATAGADANPATAGWLGVARAWWSWLVGSLRGLIGR